MEMCQSKLTTYGCAKKFDAFFFFFLLPQASKAGLCIYRPGMKMEEEESEGWLSWMWNWGGEAETPTKEVKTGGMI